MAVKLKGIAYRKMKSPRTFIIPGIQFKAVKYPYRTYWCDVAQPGADRGSKSTGAMVGESPGDAP